MSRRLRISLGIAAGIVLLALALWGVDAAELKRHIGRANAGWLAAAAALYLTAYFVRSLRWRAILRPIASVRVSESFHMLMAGYFLNYVIPIRAGEVAKSFFLKRLKGIPIATSLPTVFVDKLFELVSILFVVAMVPILSITMSVTLAALIYTVLAIFVLAMALLFFAFRSPEGASGLLCRLVSWLPAKAYARLSEFIGLFVRGMGVARREARTLWSFLGLTGLAVLIDGLYFYFMFRAFSVDVAFTRVLFGYTLLTLSYILPDAPRADRLQRVRHRADIRRRHRGVGRGTPRGDGGGPGGARADRPAHHRGRAVVFRRNGHQGGRELQEDRGRRRGRSGRPGRNRGGRRRDGGWTGVQREVASCVTSSW